MAVIFHIPGPLLVFTNGQRRIQIESSPINIGEALDCLCLQYPGIRDRILNEQGEIREHVNVFLGKDELRYLDGVATQLNDGAEITIMQAVSGGLRGVA